MAYGTVPSRRMGKAASPDQQETCFVRKAFLSILFSLCLSLPLVAGGVQEPDGPTRVVKDVWNREVAIPEDVETIAALGSMGPRMAAYLGVIDMLVGAEDSDIRAKSARYDYSLVYHDELKALPSVGKGGGSGENNAYPESLIMLQPDVIIAGFNADDCEELERQTGIPVVSIRYRTQGFIDEGFYRSLRVFASVVGKEERCEEILSYIDSCKEDLDGRTRDIPEDEKNAINVADELLTGKTGEAVDEAKASGTAYIGNNGFEVDPEKIMEWDPDIIFLDPGNMDLVNDEYRANPAFFDSLRAIQDGEVYTMPSTNAAGPNITYLLMNAYYAGIILFSDQFSDIDFRAKCAEIMEMMLGRDFYSEMEDGGLYYGKITIGG